MIGYPLIVLIFLCGLVNAGEPAAREAAAPRFSLATTSFAAGGAIASRCADSSSGGRGISPELHWTGLPAAAQTLVLIVDDADADGLVHWTVHGIGPKTIRLVEGAGTRNLKTGEMPKVSPGMVVDPWFGPCPPPGTNHTYRFTLYALDRTFPDLEKMVGQGRAAFEKAGKERIIGTAHLIGTFAGPR